MTAPGASRRSKGRRSAYKATGSQSSKPKAPATTTKSRQSRQQQQQRKPGVESTPEDGARQKLEPRSVMTQILGLELYQRLLDVFLQGLESSLGSAGIGSTFSVTQGSRQSSVSTHSDDSELENESDCGYGSGSDPVVDERSLLSHPDSHLKVGSPPSQAQAQDLPPSSNFQGTVQIIKTHLFTRDFEAAFGKPEYLPVYAARWSASRALGYASVLSELGEMIGLTLNNNIFSGTVKGSIAEKRVLCIGAGSGSEYVGFAGWVQSEIMKIRARINMNMKRKKVEKIASVASASASASTTTTLDSAQEEESHLEYNKIPKLDLQLVDLAAWAPVLGSLQTGIDTIFPSKNGAASGRTSYHHRGVSDYLRYNFHQANILDTSPSSPYLDSSSPPSLITICFTLNELFAESKAQTTRLLLEISRVVRPGACLLVVDSPGSYGVVTVGKTQGDSGVSGEVVAEEDSQRKYRMGWMLDYTLLVLAPKTLSSLPISTTESEKEEDRVVAPVWEKIRTEESRWFRVPEGLDYGTVPVENMRMQVHIYRRC